MIGYDQLTGRYESIKNRDFDVMWDAYLFVLTPLSLLLGVPLGMLKEKLRKHSLQRWLVALAPLALVPVVRLLLRIHEIPSKWLCLLSFSYN